jgi:hypothetical protein
MGVNWLVQVICRGEGLSVGVEGLIFLYLIGLSINNIFAIFFIWSIPKFDIQSFD